MFTQFSEILMRFALRSRESSTRPYSDKIKPFKVKMNLNIPNLEGNIDVESVNNWVQQLEYYWSVNKLSKAENITIASLKMSTSVQCWWENLSTKMETEEDPIDTWVKFVEKEFYLPKYLEHQYKKWQQLRQCKYQSVQSYTDEFYRLMARLGVQEEEKLLVL